MRVAPTIVLSKEEHRTLEKWASTRSTSVRLRERARIVLMAAEGMTNKAIAAQLGMDTNKVGRWRSRVATEGAACIAKERPRGANPRGQEHRGAGAIAEPNHRGDDTDDAERRRRIGRAGRWPGIWARPTASSTGCGVPMGSSRT